MCLPAGSLFQGVADAWCSGTPREGPNGAGDGVAVILTHRAVKAVCAALGDQGNLCPRRSSLVSVVVGGRDAKLLNRIAGDGEHRSESFATVIVIDVHAVE